MFKYFFYLFVVLSLTACKTMDHGLHSFTKAATLQNYESYRLPVEYYSFDVDSSKRQYKSSQLEMRIADNNNYVWPIVDYGQFIIAYRKVSRESFEKDIACYQKFIEWANQRGSESKAVSDMGNQFCKTDSWSENGFSYLYTKDELTGEPVLVATSELLFSVRAIAIDVENTQKLIGIIEKWKSQVGN